MPESSTRSMAMRVTWSMSIRRCSSSWIRYSNASLTFIFRFLVRWPKMLGSMSLMLTSISSTPWLEMISNDGKLRSRTSISTVRSSSLPSRNCWRSFSRVRLCDSAGSRCAFEHQAARAKSRRAGERGGGKQNVQQTLFGIQFGLVGDVFQLFFAHHLDGDLHQIANHGLDIAAHVADFGELRSLHLQEGRVGQLGQPAGNFRFAHAGGADHDDVLGDDFFRHLGGKLLAAHAVAQGDGHGALGVLLADNVLVEFSDDLARGEFVERDLFFFSGSG